MAKKAQAKQQDELKASRVAPMKTRGDVPRTDSSPDEVEQWLAANADRLVIANAWRQGSWPWVQTKHSLEGIEHAHIRNAYKQAGLRYSERRDAWYHRTLGHEADMEYYHEIELP